MKSNQPKKLDGHRAMVYWNNSWNHHDFPRWLRKAGVDYFKRARPHQPYHGRGDDDLLCMFPDLLDHFGSIGGADGERSFITQPYCRHDAEAQRFADTLGVVLAYKSAPGPWAPGTFLYEFRSANSPASSIV